MILFWWIIAQFLAWILPDSPGPIMLDVLFVTVKCKWLSWFGSAMIPEARALRS